MGARVARSGLTGVDGGARQTGTRMSGRVVDELEPGIDVISEWETDERGRVTSYVVVLRVERAGRWHGVRVWDNAQGVGEMHRYTRSGGKQRAQVVHRGEFGEAMRAARQHAKESYQAIIESWDQ